MHPIIKRIRLTARALSRTAILPMFIAVSMGAEHSTALAMDDYRTSHLSWRSDVSGWATSQYKEFIAPDGFAVTSFQGRETSLIAGNQSNDNPMFLSVGTQRLCTMNEQDCSKPVTYQRHLSNTEACRIEHHFHQKMCHWVRAAMPPAFRCVRKMPIESNTANSRVSGSSAAPSTIVDRSHPTGATSTPARTATVTGTLLPSVGTASTSRAFAPTMAARAMSASGYCAHVRRRQHQVTIRSSAAAATHCERQ